MHAVNEDDMPVLSLHLVVHSIQITCRHVGTINDTPQLFATIDSIYINTYSYDSPKQLRSGTSHVLPFVVSTCDCIVKQDAGMTLQDEPQQLSERLFIELLKSFLYQTTEYQSLKKSQICNPLLDHHQLCATERNHFLLSAETELGLPLEIKHQ